MQVTDEMVRVAAEALGKLRGFEYAPYAALYGDLAAKSFQAENRELARECLTAALAAMWQPIETAPKDGSKVDVWVTPPVSALSTGSYGRVSDCWFSQGSWWFYDETKYASDPANCRSEVWNVTHWMPLPPAPSQLSKRDDAWIAAKEKA